MPASQPNFELLLNAILADRKLHRAGVLVLERDGATIRHEPLPELSCRHSGARLWELHFGFAPRLADEQPRAAGLVLPVERLPHRDYEAVAVDPASSKGYTIMFGYLDASGTLGAHLYPDGEGGFRFEEADGDSFIQVEAVPLSFIWQPHPFPPQGSLPRPVRGQSALRRFVEREIPEQFAFIEGLVDFLRGCTPPEQVLVWQWARLRANLHGLRFQHPALTELYEWLAERSNRYQGIDEGGDYAAFLLAVISGVEMDDDTPNLGALRHGVGVALSNARSRGLAHWEPFNPAHIAGPILHADLDIPEEAISEFVEVVGGSLAHMLYACECINRQAILLGNEERPFPDEPEECVAFLMRLRPLQPTLMTVPAFGRFVPKRSRDLFPVSDEAELRLARDCPDVDPTFSGELAREIDRERRYVLDHVAIVDVDGFGVRRITLSPERYVDGQKEISFLIEHRLGIFGGDLALALEEEGGEMEVHLALAPIEELDAREQIGSAIQLMTLAVWRDLVVPQVIEEQYETETVRKPKDKGRSERKQRKGDVAVVRYLPRRLIAHRAEQEARRAGGRPALRELYWVGTFARRLREGEHRSYEADAYAREIGMPLQPWQTVVHPHPRGGTAEEREQAKADPPEIIRHWRSWSALDLLRTRGPERSPVG